MTISGTNESKPTKIVRPLTPLPIKTSMTVGIIAVAAVGASLMSAPGGIGLLGAGLALLMLTIAVIDRRSFIIPDALNAAAAGLGIVHAVAQDPDAMTLACSLAAIRGITFASLFMAIRVAYARVRGREGLGLGDIKLAGAAGVWLDWSMMPVAIQIAAFTALAVYGTQQFALGRPIAATSRLPFGLFFAPAIWICWMIEVTLWASF